MLKRSNTKDVFDLLTEQQEAGGKATELDHQATDSADDATDRAEDGVEEDGTVDETDEKVNDSKAEAANEVPELPRGRRRLRRVLLGAGAIALLAAIGLAAFFGWRVKQQNEVDVASQTALQVARNYTVLLTSVDSQKLDENFNQVLDGATGEFKDMYSQSAAQLRQLLIDNKAVSHGTVVDAGIKSATKNKVEVLIFVDQSISNAVNPNARIDRSRVAITMERVDNRWLASKVDIK